MLQPKRTKFRKAFKGKIKGKSKGGTALAFGAFGLKALEPERVTARQIEATRRAVTRHMKRQGQSVDPDLSRYSCDRQADRSSHGQGQGALSIAGSRVSRLDVSCLKSMV